MRIRSTKPEFWRSRRVASVTWDARLVLKGLESYVDDNGVGKDDLALIVGDVFQRDLVANPRETLARVSEAISALHEAGLLWRYEDSGTDLLYIAFWESIQRVDKPGKGRFRRPDGTLEYGESAIRESVASPRETLAPGTGEQGNRGTGEQGRNPSSDKSDQTGPPERFDEFWDTYGNKVGRKKAETPTEPHSRSPASPQTCSSPLLPPTSAGSSARASTRPTPSTPRPGCTASTGATNGPPELSR
jgi:hypothetical protein